MKREHILVHLLREGAEALATAQRRLVNAETEAGALGYDPRGRLVEAKENLSQEWALYEKTLASVDARLRELDEIERTTIAPDEDAEVES
jgi:hypothetical protein